MIGRPKFFLAVEAMLLAAAALVHAGLLLGGYEHVRAATAESVIALTLLVGLIGVLAAPGSTRIIAIAVQGFALLGVLVGIFTIAIGVGPQTAADYVLHAVLAPVLLLGFLIATLSRSKAQSKSAAWQ